MRKENKVTASQHHRFVVAAWVARAAHSGLAGSSLLAAVILGIFAGALRAAM